MTRKKVNVISLGCSKNLVDSERLMKMLLDGGMEVVHEASSVSSGDIVVINTCGFIGDAKEESVNTILQWVDAKEQDRLDRFGDTSCFEISGYGFLRQGDYHTSPSCLS